MNDPNQNLPNLAPLPDPNKPVAPVVSQPLSPAPPVRRTDDSKEGLRSIVKTVLLLLAAPLVALFVTNFVFHSYEVYGPSMDPTLHNSDRLIVLKAPRTWSRIRGQHYMPMRWQIVVFHRPEYLAGYDENKQLIKRVIALPGERVVVKDGSITVYNSEHPQGFNPDTGTDYGPHIPHTDGSGEFVVGEDEVFVSGDNRTNSLDSRTFGPIKSDSIIGTAEYRLFPLGDMRGF